MAGSLEGWRLSPQQKHLWLLAAGSAADPFCGLCSVQITGPLSPGRLRESLETVCRRNEILCTCFRSLPGMTVPLQVPITGGASLTWEHHDLRELDQTAQQIRLRKLLDELADQRFDYGNLPLVRASLASLSAETSILHIALPALYADEAGIIQLLRDTSRVYAGAEIQAADEAPRYGVLAEWQNQLLSADEARECRGLWARKDSSSSEPRLSYEKSTSENDFRPKTVEISLDDAVIAQLRTWTAANDSFPAAGLFTGWAILVARLAGVARVQIGAAFSGRHYAEFAQSIGLFERYVPITCHCNHGESPNQVLKRIDKRLRETNEYQEYFSWEESDQHNSTGPAFLPFAFRYVSQQRDWTAADLSFSIRNVHSVIDRFKLKFECVEVGDAIAARIEYDSTLFADEDLRVLGEQLRTLFASLAANSEAVTQDLQILGEGERRKLLNRAGPQRDYPPLCLHQLFEAQVQHGPHRTAATISDQKLTYAELNARANQLAHALRNRGAGPDVPVAVCVERSLELLVGIFGILKAGGGFVPIDPSTPADRAKRIAANAGARVVLTQTRHRAMFAELDIEPLILDENLAMPDADRTTTPASAVGPDNLAYVIYTSGSTGQPKGVMITHRAVANYLNWCLASYPQGGGGGVPLHTSVGFDLTITSLFLPLLAGQRIVILPDDSGAEVLADTWRREGEFSFVKLTPAHLGLLQEQISERELAQKKGTFIIGGEQLLAEDLIVWRRNAPNLRLFNEYGPTEATVGCTVFEVIGDATKRGPVPIGKPIANTRIYLLDIDLQPVATGETGEIYIAGDGLARGYLHDPALTAEKFLPNPCGQPGTRIYKTGDLGRYVANEQIEFVGRADRQLKIRGYRVELREIESALDEHPQIEAARVLVLTTSPVDLMSAQEAPTNYAVQRLAACILVGSAQTPPSTTELRQQLAKTLPEYMLPHVVVPVDSWPLTPNGKLDEKALRGMATRALQSNNGYRAPAGDTELALASVWANVLQLDKVGADDNFFELGGDSIIAIQIVGRARGLGLALTVRDIFRYQTIAELAAVVASNDLPVAEELPIHGAVPLSPIQSWFIERDLPNPNRYNQAIVFELTEEISLDVLRTIVGHLVLHHDALRLRVARRERALQQWCAEPDEDHDSLVDFYDLSALSAELQDERLDEYANKAQQSLDLERVPLLRSILFDLGVRGKRFLLVIHHWGADGVSWRILLRDWQLAYEQIKRGEPVDLGAKPASFQRWTQFLTQRAQKLELRQEASYWLSQDRRSAGSLVVDSVSDANVLADARDVRRELSVDETSALFRYVPAAFQTQIDEALLSALWQTLYWWTGKPQWLLRVVGHGREEFVDSPDVTHTVGWLTIVYPLLLDLSELVADSGEAAKAARPTINGVDDNSLAASLLDPGKVLIRVKEQMRSVPQAGIGYGLLRYLSDDPDLRRSLREMAEPSINFNHLGQLDLALGASSVLRPATESPGATHSPDEPRPHLLDIVTLVMNGQLQITWTYNVKFHRTEAIEAVADHYVHELQRLILHCADLLASERYVAVK